MKLCAVGLVAVVGFAASAFGQITNANGYATVARNFNDFGNSSLTINGTAYTTANETGAISGLSPVIFNEQFQVGGAGFANRHFAWLSTDNGASRYSFGNSESFRIDTSVQIQTGGGETPGGNLQPRREAGFAIFNRRTIIEGNPASPNFGMPVTFTDEGYFLVASDGEVAIFGGALPFFSFGNAAYTLGSVAQMSFIYNAPGTFPDPTGQNRAAVRYIFNGATSPMLFVDNNSDISGGGFGAGTNIGVRAQNQRNPNFPDSAVTTYRGLTVIPTPGAAALLGLAGLAAARRRRA